MSEDLHQPPHRRSTDAVCPYHAGISDDLGEIKQGVKRIEGRLGTGDISLATLALRVQFLEKLVYGAVGLALTAVLGAVLALVVKGGAGS